HHLLSDVTSGRDACHRPRQPRRGQRASVRRRVHHFRVHLALAELVEDAQARSSRLSQSRRVVATFSRTYFLLTALAVSLTLLASAVALRRRGARWTAVETLRLTMVGAFAVGTCSHLEN